MSINSRSKGIRGERQVIDFLQPFVNTAYGRLRDCGYRVGETPVLQRNTLQCDRGGVDVAGLDWLALEIKNCATATDGQVGRWWSQCLEQARPGQMPVLVYKVGRGNFRVRLHGRIAHVGGLHFREHAKDWLPNECEIEISMREFANYFERRTMFEAVHGPNKV